MSTAYATSDDVQQALQESDASFGTGELDTANVEAAINGVSEWFKTRSQAHFYDSTATGGELATTTESATNLLLSVPSSPHRQSGQLWAVSEDTISQRYPNTHTGQYCRVKLPRRFVDSIDKLEVRSVGGEVEDWVASNEFEEGRGEDYYVVSRGAEDRGRSHLYIHASSLGAHISFEDVLTAECSYGLDYQDEPWDDVRRGVAALAAAQLIADDNVLAGLPEGGSALGVDTQVQQLVNIALGLDGDVGGYLSPYLTVAVE
jgi:hypothetical protein